MSTLHRRIGFSHTPDDRRRPFLWSSTCEPFSTRAQQRKTRRMFPTEKSRFQPVVPDIRGLAFFHFLN
jgi:hypothetical protein